MNYHSKYLKYKKKYLDLKQRGGVTNYCFQDEELDKYIIEKIEEIAPLDLINRLESIIASIANVGGLIGDADNTSFFKFISNVLADDFGRDIRDISENYKIDSIKIPFYDFYENIEKKKLQKNTIYHLKFNRTVGHWVYLNNDGKVETSYSENQGTESRSDEIEDRYNIYKNFQINHTNGFCQTFALIFIFNANGHPYSQEIYNSMVSVNSVGSFEELSDEEKMGYFNNFILCLDWWCYIFYKLNEAGEDFYNYFFFNLFVPNSFKRTIKDIKKLTPSDGDEFLVLSSFIRLLKDNEIVIKGVFEMIHNS